MGHKESWDLRVRQRCSDYGWNPPSLSRPGTRCAEQAHTEHRAWKQNRRQVYTLFKIVVCLVLQFVCLFFFLSSELESFWCVFKHLHHTDALCSLISIRCVFEIHRSVCEVDVWSVECDGSGTRVRPPWEKDRWPRDRESSTAWPLNISVYQWTPWELCGKKNHKQV